MIGGSVVAFFMLFLLSCSQVKPLEQKPAHPKPVMSYEIEKLLEGYQPFEEPRSCESCVLGSFYRVEDEESEEEEDLVQFFTLQEMKGIQLSNTLFDFPVVDNHIVRGWVNYFTEKKTGVEGFQRYVHRSGRYAPLMSEILHHHGLPRDLIFLAMAESGFHNQAKSWAKAVGPWQFMAMTGKKYGLKIDWYRDERRDPIKATHAASAYLKDLYELFGSWELAAAAYNAGEGRVGRAVRNTGKKDFWAIRQTRYLRMETKNYVPKIMALAIIGKNLESFGYEQIDFDQPIAFETVEVPPLTDLFRVASALGIEIQELQKWNPELLRWQTPPDENYFLRLPLGGKEQWQQCCTEETNFNMELAYQNYQIQNSGSTLNGVAKKFSLPVDVLTSLNEYSAHQPLASKTLVRLPFREGQSHRDGMYRDLYEKPPKWRRRRMAYNQTLQRALANGEEIANPREYYTVQKGDSLWSVSRKFNIPLNNLIKTNYSKVKSGYLRPGDVLAIR